MLRQHEPAEILGFRAGLPKVIGDCVETGEARVQDDEPLVGVEQAESLDHVVESDAEPLVMGA